MDHNPPPPDSYGYKVQALPKRNQNLFALSRRFYINEQGVLVSNGLSTEMICFPSDRLPGREERLEQKIRQAMAYSTSFIDIEELNALKHIAPHTSETAPDGTVKKTEPDNYLALGLYLYLADECSRLKKDKTFLTAMREAKLALPIDEKYSSRDLLERAQQALKILGINEHSKLLDSWFANGNYQINGEMHKGDGTKEGLAGTYAKLAREICMRQTYLGMNYPISYALGNRPHIEGKSEDEMLEYTKNLLKPENKGMIDGLIQEGTIKRENRIKKVVQEVVPEPAAGEHQQWQPKARFAMTVLGKLPDAALALLENEGYMIAYTNTDDVRNGYPLKDLPGISHDDNELSRESKALRQSRHRTIFLSNGNRMNPDDVNKDPSLKQSVLAQSLLHETMHIIVSYLTPEEKKTLDNAVQAVSEELGYKSDLPVYFNRPLKTIDTSTLLEVVKYDGTRPDKRGLYENYSKLDEKDKKRPDTRREEVACNVYGMMHTEFPYPPKAGAENPYRDLPSLGHLASQIQRFADLAVERSEKECATMKGKPGEPNAYMRAAASGVGQGAVR